MPRVAGSTNNFPPNFIFNHENTKKDKCPTKIGSIASVYYDIIHYNHSVNPYFTAFVYFEPRIRRKFFRMLAPSGNRRVTGEENDEN